MFVHSHLDDYGLTAPEFRVYGHLIRRASRTGKAWPKVNSMAQVCHLHPKTVRSALKKLVSFKMIVGEPRSGDTTIYTLLPCSQWRPPVRSGIAKDCDRTRVSEDSGPPPKSMQPAPSQMDAAEGSPNKENPAKVSPYSPPKGDTVTVTASSSVQEEQIYDIYPKKVGRPAALRAIRRALAKHPFEFLVDRTRLYAQTCNFPLEFIPNPSTWFGQERFKDDPSAWRRSTSPTAKRQPAIVRPDGFGCGISNL